MTTRFKTTETILDDHLEVAFQWQIVKSCRAYDGGTARKRLKVRIELTHATKKRRATSVTELIDAIKKLGIAPQEYAACEPITLARAASFLGDGRRTIYSHPLFEEMLTLRGLSITDYMPRWEAPFLVYYVLDSSDGLVTVQEQRMIIA